MLKQNPIEIYFLKVLEAGNLEIRVPVWPVLVGLPSFWTLSGHRSLPFLTRSLILLDLDPTLMTSFNLNYLLNALSLEYSQRGDRASIHGFFWEVIHPIAEDSPVFLVSGYCFDGRSESV